MDTYFYIVVRFHEGKTIEGNFITPAKVGLISEKQDELEALEDVLARAKKIALSKNYRPKIEETNYVIESITQIFKKNVN